ncbi:unnamed protein product [Heligmosomoides polygyrus]|uniref:MTP_lip_bd domain-containing protein n=1 Tax=Heligmosomoides polygyrus TaxID=6339 RepID=A0A3P7WTX9_HELPZ|nr:unnamed protein product [Heligmosomoides polygyrus]
MEVESLYAESGSQPLHANADRARKTAPVGEDMTRYIKVDYSFETESVLYDVVENKAAAPSTIIAGNFSFESLHHDLEGGMLGRYSLTECKTNNCGDLQDVYVSFVQGGNNIQEVLYDPTKYPNRKPRWNFLYAIINTIYTPAEGGQGDNQIVDTVYGKCLVQFGRPEDKRFRRLINNCELKGDVNYTRFGGIQPVKYEQDVSYVQNVKIDADIVIIDAIELLTFRTPFHKRWGFTLESRTHVEITNRTMMYVPRHCNAETHTAAQCASDKFGAVSVGNKLYESVTLGQRGKKSEYAQVVRKYLEHLFDMGDSHTCEKHSEMFAEVVQEGRRASEEEWKAVLMKAENEPMLHVLGNALGAIGDSRSLKIARKVLFVEGPEFLDDYLLGAAHTTSDDEKWHKQLMYWLAEVKEEELTYWKVANTLATVLRRRSVERARGFLCTAMHSPEVQMAALQVIKAASSSLYDIKLANVLLKLFRNVCPQPTSTGESQLAIDILVRCLPDHQHVATMLLRSESLNPDNHEKWQYFYKAVESSSRKDELKEELWRRMRKFKVFRPNYAHRSLIANSHAHWTEIAEIDSYKLHSSASVEFDTGVFRRSEFDIRLKHGKEDESLFGLTTSVVGLDSFVREQTTPADPEAEVRLSFLGHALPQVTLFKGATDLMSVVWNADGQTVKALEGNVMLRDTATVLPLLSGLTVEVATSGALSLKILTSASVSIWEQHTLADLNANISIGLGTRVSLLHHGEVVNKLSSNLALVTNVGAAADVHFGQVPFEFCVTMQRDNARLSLESSEEEAKKPTKKRTSTSTTIHPGVTYKLEDSITRQCNSLERTHGSPVE